ncbi:hypothetical protein CfE428DRAFT_6054 [Chthoniobacter flavus Ellin428]|uniref:Uncharacterized protein n=2 Tax=Chthoniobacter flavus TaxID=191863 RepID=B4DAW3_9BACT|nr:hypothetical protein CfE428DRAFT_6054 [Chthoniobacter flavus Ellin428]
MNGMRRSEGGTTTWVVVLLLMLAIVGYLAWQKFASPTPPPKVVVAPTPAPATPPPATPEPVVVKATPTPPPVVVVATPPPTPVPTPPPLDITMVVRTPALWPQQVLLVQPVTLPVILNGRNVGEAKVPVGTALRVLRLGAEQVEIEYQNARYTIRVASTDLMQRALAAFRANGSVLPTAPVAAASQAPQAPVTPAVTLPPGEAARLKIDVSVDRKRTNVAKDSAAGNRGEDEKVTEKYTYAITVQSREFVEVPPLDVQYLVFVERQKLGSQRDDNPIERITGSGKTGQMNRKDPTQVVTSSEFEISRQIQNSKYGGYVNGGRRKVEDSIVGVWVKVLKDGQIVAEYTNPSTIKKRGWDKSEGK